MLRDRLRAQLDAMGDTPDYVRLAADVLGIAHAPPDLARRLVAQALVIEDRREVWQEIGARVVEGAPTTPGVYVLRDAAGQVLYVGKAVNLRRRLRTHFASRMWRGLKAPLARVTDVEWREVGSELEALLREALLIDELQPLVNVQVGEPTLAQRALPTTLVKDVLVVVPSVKTDSAELVAARVEGGTLLQRTRRDGSDLTVHARRVYRFFHSPLRDREVGPALAPLVFSWLARRGARASRLDPHEASSFVELRGRMARLLADEAVFTERIVVR